MGEEISFEASNNNQQGRTCGSSRDERLDPFGLPLHFELTDRAGDERMRLVELRGNA